MSTYTDDFSSGLGSDWGTFGDPVSVVAGELHIPFDPASPHDHTGVVWQHSFVYGVVSARIRMSAGAFRGVLLTWLADGSGGGGETDFCEIGAGKAVLRDRQSSTYTYHRYDGTQDGPHSYAVPNGPLTTFHTVALRVSPWVASFYCSGKLLGKIPIADPQAPMKLHLQVGRPGDVAPGPGELVVDRVALSVAG